MYIFLVFFVCIYGSLIEGNGLDGRHYYDEERKEFEAMKNITRCLFHDLKHFELNSNALFRTPWWNLTLEIKDNYRKRWSYDSTGETKLIELNYLVIVRLCFFKAYFKKFRTLKTTIPISSCMILKIPEQIWKSLIEKCNMIITISKIYAEISSKRYNYKG